MIGLPSVTSIYLCTQPVDFRKGFDGLTGVVTTALGSSVTDWALFLFVNRKRDRIKALWWETGGLTLWYQRLEQETVELPKAVDRQSHVCIDNVELAMWTEGVPLKAAKTRRKRMKAAQSREPTEECFTDRSCENLTHDRFFHGRCRTRLMLFCYCLLRFSKRSL